jgi:hypothetical protein
MRKPTLCEFVYKALGELHACYGERPAPQYTPRKGWQIGSARVAAPWYPAAMVACFEGAGNAFVLGSSPEDWAESCAEAARFATNGGV